MPHVSAPSLSSGDLTVDRRAGFAAALARSLDFAGAAEAMESALELAPHWAAGWHLLGEYRAQAGNADGAAAAYGRVKALDAPADLASGLALAAHGAGPMPSGTDVGYVEALFDEYASRFDKELVEDLGYELPQMLGGLVRTALAGRRVGRAVDLGCGTGLMGPHLRPLCALLEGVDLSKAMLAEAQAKTLYDRLEHAELVAFLMADPGGIDLLVAADVLNYCAALPPVLSAAQAAMAPQALFGFSLELHDGAGTLLQRRQLRYAHNQNEAIAACVAAGFEVMVADRVSTRRERDVPVDGLVLLLRKPAQAARAASSAA